MKTGPMVVRFVGALVLVTGVLLPPTEAAAEENLGWVCAFVACGDWAGADEACPGGQTAQQMTCSSDGCEEGGNNRILCQW